MRWLVLPCLMTLVTASLAHANSYARCDAPLLVGADPIAPPLSELSFLLTLSEHSSERRFTAQGTAFDGSVEADFRWSGHWIHQHDFGIRMIGPIALGAQSAEWRAHTLLEEPDVMLIEIDKGDGDLFTVRCLPTDGA